MASRFALLRMAGGGEAEASGQKLDPQARFTVQITATTVLSLIAAYACAWFVGVRPPNLLGEYLGYTLLALFLIAAISLFGLTVSLLINGERRPLQVVGRRTAQYLSIASLTNRVLPILLAFGFLAAFSTFKQLIPRMHGYSWDGAFSDLDRLLFGTDPWRLTHSVIGPEGTEWLDRTYYTWLAVFAAVVLWHSVFAPFDQKRRFFLTFFTCWIFLGIVAATIFSSAGPCFLTLINDPTAVRYAFFPLEHAPRSQWIMDYLADGYRSGDFGMAKGISAMPSMHIAVVTLFVLTTRRFWTRLLALAYAAAILVGSVHLGWHYAVDGIFAAIATVLVYRTTAQRSARAAMEVDRTVPLAA